MAKRNALGRGLGALIDDADTSKQSPASSINEIEIKKIKANRWQPRTNFDEEALNELATSIKEVGIIQPITLRSVGEDKYELIAGERRFRASMIAGLKTIPAYVRETDDQNMLELALVENIQREDLDSIEVALSYQRLLDECKLTQEELSDRVGKKRSTISNYLRLLKLPAVIQKAIRERNISMGHARAIVNVKDPQTQIMIYQQIVKYDFSVRKVEDIVRKLNSGEDIVPSKNTEKKPDEQYGDLKKHLSNRFNTNVGFKINNKGKGQIVIPFASSGQLEEIISLLDKINK